MEVERTNCFAAISFDARDFHPLAGVYRNGVFARKTALLLGENPEENLGSIPIFEAKRRITNSGHYEFLEFLLPMIEAAYDQEDNLDDLYLTWA